MKRTLITMMLASTLLGACSSSNPFNQSEGNQVAVADKLITTDYSDQGVILNYTLLGKLKSIEVYGVAAAWKSNPAIIAEADAKEKLVKFVYGEEVTSDRNVKILAKSIENSKDNALNPYAGNSNSFESADLALEVEADAATGSKEDNTSRRIAERLDETINEAITTIVSSGRLVGVRKISDQVLDDGRLYVAKYVWSEDTAILAGSIRNTMGLY